MKITAIVPVTVLILLVIAMLFTAGWNHPPVEAVQQGYRGLGMVAINNPGNLATKVAANQIPAALPAAPEGGPTAGETYKNVQVLGDLNVAQFTRLMAAMTAWVAPEQGCNYCHNPADLAADDLYTKVVSRRMLQMTRHINNDWKDHVADTGVTCYTCHRGHPVPQNLWFTDIGPDQAHGMSAGRQGQNLA
jgi:photosynthetic reaction center cytochrome c subunit